MMNSSMLLEEICGNSHYDNNSQEKIFKNIVQQLPIPVIIFDKNLLFMAASNRFFDESPLKKENVKIDDHWYKLVPDMPLKWKMIHQRCLQGEEITCEEDPFPREDGSTEWWKWRIKPWYLSSGEIGGIILYVENITGKKEDERSLQRNIRSLEKSNNSLSRFAHICAHDLNQSLRTISLYAQIIQTDYSSSLDPSLKKYMNRMIKTIEQMKNFIRSTLDFSHLKNNKIAITNTCMLEVVNNVVMVLKKEIAQKQALINYKDLPPVHANKDLMTQLVQNLISNSLKYSGSTPPIIDITAVDKGEWVLFAVKDNGMGIEKRYLKKIFCEHTRLNPDDQKGTGVGLTYCNKIIKEHAGKIWASSTLNKGTTIFFLLSKEKIKTPVEKYSTKSHSC
ncbi:MAG: PAS domain S-box protein [Candidatus Paracaedibacteraceae bacterium]|nr:PAS domain S-box protein [Candidatus Paracaedibacteraceae bacterium]